MNINPLNLIGGILLMAIIFGSGYCLTRAGNPYPMIVMTIHKLLSVAVSVILIVTLVRAHRVAPLSATVLITSIVAILGFLGLIATGALLSGEADLPAFVRKVHHIAPYVTLMASGVTLFFLQR